MRPLAKKVTAAKKRGGAKRSAADGLFHFIEGHESLRHELVTRLAQPPEGFFIQGLRDFLDGGRAADRLSQGVIHAEQLEEWTPARVPGSQTLPAADGDVEGADAFAG